MEHSRDLPPSDLSSRHAAEEEPYVPDFASQFWDRRHLLDYVRVLSKRRRMVLSVFFVIVGAVSFYNWTAITMYRAQARLLIEPEDPKVIAFQDVLTHDGNSQEYQKTQYEILQSRALAERTFLALTQEDQAKFRAAAQQVSIVRRAAAATKAVITGRHTSDEQEKSGTAQKGKPAFSQLLVETFRESLNVAPVAQSRLVDVIFETTEPELAANIVNTLARSFLDQNLERKVQVTKQASDWLQEELEKQRKQVEESELALQRYRETSKTLASSEDRQNVVSQELTDLNAAFIRAKTRRIEKETIYDELRLIEADPVALASFPPILANPFIQQLRSQLVDLQRQHAQLAQRLGDEHPQMLQLQSAIDGADARLRGEIEKTAQAIKGEFLAAQGEERNLTAAVDERHREAIAIKGQSFEYDVLERNLKTDRQIFDTLLQRAKETDVSATVPTNHIQVVDTATVPKEPSRPAKAFNLLLALVGGLVFGVGLALFCEYLDHRIKSPDDIKAHLGTPFLGLVPVIPAKLRTGGTPLINNGVPPKFGEAFRVVRTSVLFTFPRDEPHSLVVTSVGPGEGKTVVACNLAISLAQAGQRVLLVDADLRRPRLHDIFGHAQEPGLSTLMAGGATASQVVRDSAIPGLFVLPSGPSPPNPAEVLLLPRFEALLKVVSESFNWVIVDSPPVMAVTDAPVIARLVSGVVFVVGADMTSRQAAQAALEQLDHARAPFMGTILNKVDLNRNAFYFAKYYRRVYDQHYIQSDALNTFLPRFSREHRTRQVREQEHANVS